MLLIIKTCIIMQNVLIQQNTMRITSMNSYAHTDSSYDEVHSLNNNYYSYPSPEFVPDQTIPYNNFDFANTYFISTTQRKSTSTLAKHVRQF